MRFACHAGSDTLILALDKIRCFQLDHGSCSKMFINNKDNLQGTTVAQDESEQSARHMFGILHTL